MNGLIFLWTVLTWMFKPLFCPNDWLQIKQVNGLIFSWTVLTWMFKTLLYPNDMLQIWQVNDLIFWWTVLSWVSKWLLHLNDCLQIKQMNGFTFSWTVLTWMFRPLLCSNEWLQIKQEVSHFHELLWNVLLIFSYFQMNYGKSDTPSFSSLHDPFWVGYPAFQALKLPIYGRSKILFVAKFRIQVNLSDDETSLANELHKRSEVWRRKKIAICSQHAQLLKKWAILGPFFFFCLFYSIDR